MGDCGCDKAKKDIEEYLHNELCSEQAADIQEHMQNCEECAYELQVGIVLSEAVKKACNETAPRELKRKINEILNK